MTTNIQDAKKDVDEIYNYLIESAMNVIDELTAPLDKMIDELSKNINLRSNAELWDYQMRIGVETYRLSNVKEQSSLKDLCANALYKEGLAKSFSDTTGTQEAKKQQSLLDNLDRQAVSMLYTSIAAMLKAKCDEAHRLVAIIQGIQISRAAEAKQNSSPRSEPDKLEVFD